MEPWTEKHFSPLVIGDALQATAEWAQQQDSSADDALVIKTNERTREVSASKEIDDQLLTIAIRLPSNFPLGSVSVEGVNRVAVEEKKWKSWLLNTQGVITFSDNSIVDGLITFRRNVNGQVSTSLSLISAMRVTRHETSRAAPAARALKSVVAAAMLKALAFQPQYATCTLHNAGPKDLY